MTELETMERAKMYLDKLSHGIDPLTERELPSDTALNQVRLARCFAYVSEILGQVIANGGTVGGKAKLLPFAATPEQLKKVAISPEPVRVTQLVDRITEFAGKPQMKKLSTTIVTNWLLEKGFLEKQPNAEGKVGRVPTQSGRAIGISTETRMGQYGAYQAVFYNQEAQRFILEHLPEMLRLQ